MPRVGAGDYRERVLILPRVLTKDAATLEDVEDWPDPPPGTPRHAAKIEGRAGAEALDENRQSWNTFNLRFRHVVPLAAVDCVWIAATETSYAISGVWTELLPAGGGKQTVCSVIG